MHNFINVFPAAAFIYQEDCANIFANAQACSLLGSKDNMKNIIENLLPHVSENPFHDIKTINNVEFLISYYYLQKGRHLVILLDTLQMNQALTKTGAYQEIKTEMEYILDTIQRNSG